jgi:hypothetical protein
MDSAAESIRLCDRATALSMRTLLARAAAAVGVILLTGAASGLSQRACAQEQAAKAPAPPAQHCEVAVVSPVSGYAECVKPRGAPVEPPPPRPAPSADECRRHPEVAAEACPENEPAKAR